MIEHLIDSSYWGPYLMGHCLGCGANKAAQAWLLVNSQATDTALAPPNSEKQATTLASSAKTTFSIYLYRYRAQISKHIVWTEPKLRNKISVRHSESFQLKSFLQHRDLNKSSFPFLSRGKGGKSHSACILQQHPALRFLLSLPNLLIESGCGRTCGAELDGSRVHLATS